VKSRLQLQDWTIETQPVFYRKVDFPELCFSWQVAPYRMFKHLELKYRKSRWFYCFFIRALSIPKAANKRSTTKYAVVLVDRSSVNNERMGFNDIVNFRTPEIFNSACSRKISALFVHLGIESRYILSVCIKKNLIVQYTHKLKRYDAIRTIFCKVQFFSFCK